MIITNLRKTEKNRSNNPKRSCFNCRWVGCKHFGYDRAACSKYISPDS